MKLGIIRCQQTEHLCPGTKCLQGAQPHLYNFEQFKDEPIELIGMVSCGGCPGKQVNARAAELVKRGGRCHCLGELYLPGQPHRLSLSLQGQAEANGESPAWRGRPFH